MKKAKLLTSLMALALVVGLGACDEKSEECPVCPEQDDDTDLELECEHEYGEYIVTEEGHYQVCLICGETTPVEAHTASESFTIAQDDTRYHVKTCIVCGYELERAPHQVKDEDGDCEFCNAVGLNTNGLTYQLNSDEQSYYVSSYDMSLDAEDVYVPASYNGLPVTEIGTANASAESSSAFHGSSSSTSGYHIHFVSLPTSITAINPYAFYNCYSLISVVIPEAVTTIGNSAFYDCYSLTNIIFLGNDNLTSIGTSAFYYNYSLISISLPDSITTIGENAFYYCYSLIDIKLPANLTAIETKTFYDCYSLTSIDIPSKVRTIGDSVFYYCYSLTSISFPQGLTTIGSNVCYYCYSLTSVSIPDSVSSIGSYAFGYCCSLTSLTFPTYLTDIAGSMVYRDYSLKYVVIPISVQTIGGSCFQYCYSFTNVFYMGNANDWESIEITSTNNSILDNATMCYYDESGESALTDIENTYWHYVDGIPTIWQLVSL